MAQEVDNEAELKAAPVADYMRIRQYVMALTMRKSAPQAMIPSMNELARSFGVTRMTVHKALKDLIRERYLIVRKGIGTYVNPAMMRGEIGNGPERCFGIIVGSGKHCFYDAYYWESICAFGNAVTERPWNVKFMNFSSFAPKSIAKEIKDNFVDGVAWIDPYEKNGQEALRLLRKEGFPAVAIHAQIDGVDCVRMDWESHAYEIGKKLLAEGRRNVVFADFKGILPVESQLKGLRKAFEDAGVKFNEGLVLKADASQAANLERILELGIDIQAVYLSSPCLGEILPALQKFGIDIDSRCRLVAEPFLLGETPGFRGLVRKYRFDEMAKAALEVLMRSHDSALGQPECRKFTFELEKRGIVQ